MTVFWLSLRVRRLDALVVQPSFRDIPVRVVGGVRVRAIESNLVEFGPCQFGSMKFLGVVLRDFAEDRTWAFLPTSVRLAIHLDMVESRGRVDGTE